MGKRWSDEELKILREFFPTEGGSVSMRMPGRSKNACLRKASRLKLVSRSIWTPEELEIMKEYYPEEGTAVYLRLPYRTRETCREKARKLHLRCVRPSGRRPKEPKEEDTC